MSAIIHRMKGGAGRCAVSIWSGRRRIPTIALLAVLGGCATVDPTSDYEWARDEVSTATGENGLYQPGDELEIAEQVGELLGDGLYMQEAVQVCLLNNGEIRTKLMEIGIRRAGAVQAGLLSNPSLGVMFRLPLGDGSAVTELGLIQNLIELWRISPRKHLAQSQLEQTVLEVAHEAASLVAETKMRYARAAGALAALKAAEENHATAREFLELTLTRQEAGATTQVDVNAARSEFLEQEAWLREASFAVFESKRELLQILGVPGHPGDIVLLDTLRGIPNLAVELPRMLELARDSRLDLRAAAKYVASTESALVLEDRSLFRQLGAGLSLESEGGETQLGPAVRLEIPIFDQNQAQIAKAEYRHAQALRQFEALNIQVEQEVRGALEEYSVASDLARLYRDQILPLRQSSLELARESLAQGKTRFLSVLEAQGELLAARREYVERLEAVSESIPGIEAACGRPLSEILSPAQSD